MTRETRVTPQSGAGYDQLPYPSLPVSYTQPAQLAAMAWMFGLKTADASRARVLEIGCAGGGNLIPLALRFPEASFSGIDLSLRHVEDANRRIGELGLGNIGVRQGDLAQAQFEGRFDFIICHGVYSWVSRAAQEAILRLCGEHLAEEGIAAISYNVLPGWHMRSVVRDLCLYYAGPASSPPAKRVAQAREALQAIAATLEGNSSIYATLLKSEVARLARTPPAYWHGEFLSEHNDPCHFSTFAARAAAAGLGYVCDAEVATALPEYLLPQAAAKIREAARSHALSEQQHLDLFSGRPFRRSILARRSRAQSVSRSIDAERLARLHFSAAVVRNKAGAFRDVRGNNIAAEDAASAHVLEQLSQAWPSTRTLDELLGPHAADASARTRALNLLLAMMGREQATSFTLPLRAGNAAAQRPKAWRLAQIEAAVATQNWLTGLHHRPVAKTPGLALLLTLMDGTRRPQDLAGAAAAAIADGRLKDIAEKSPEALVANTLVRAARGGLLEP